MHDHTSRPAPGALAGPDGGLTARPERDRGASWLRNAVAALGIRAAAAAVVSWDAQYVMVSQARHTPAIATLEAGTPGSRLENDHEPELSAQAQRRLEYER